MTNILIVIGWIITAILSYVVGEKLHFIQRKKEKLEKFENAIDDYCLTAPSMSSNGVPSSKYDNFTAFYVCLVPIKRQKWLEKHNITEIQDFYEWMDKKAHGWGNFYNKFKQN